LQRRVISYQLSVISQDRMGDYEALKVWEKAHRITLEVYRVTRPFPPSETYGLTSQLRRSAASVPSNLAEGTGRNSQRELARFCRIALGSANELHYQLRLARDLGFLSPEEHRSLSDEVANLRRMLAKFIVTLGPPVPTDN
jgi:four helix bundle protein